MTNDRFELTDEDREEIEAALGITEEPFVIVDEAARIEPESDRPGLEDVMELATQRKGTIDPLPITEEPTDDEVGSDR